MWKHGKKEGLLKNVRVYVITVIEAYLYANEICCSLVMTDTGFCLTRLNLMRKNSVVRLLMPSRTSMESGNLCTASFATSLQYIVTLMTVELL